MKKTIKFKELRPGQKFWMDGEEYTAIFCITESGTLIYCMQNGYLAKTDGFFLFCNIKEDATNIVINPNQLVEVERRRLKDIKIGEEFVWNSVKYIMGQDRKRKYPHNDIVGRTVWRIDNNKCGWFSNADCESLYES